MNIFVLMSIESAFVGAYDSHQKAKEVMDRMRGTMLDHNNGEAVELIIEKTTLNDLSMFNPIQTS